MSTNNFRTGRHVVYDLHAHVVLTPKYRRKIMTDRVTALLADTFDEVAARFEASLEAFETDSDHALLLLAYPPKISLSRLVMSLKTISSHRVRQMGWPEVTRALWVERFWSPSYCVVSTGGAALEIVNAYIENQRTPNRPPGRPSGATRNRS